MATSKSHWVARAAAIAGMPIGLLLMPIDAFVAFAMAFNGHPATLPSCVYFLIATVLVIVDVAYSISLLRGKRGPAALVVTSGAQLAAAVIYVVVSLVIGSIEEAQWVHWIALTPLVLRFIALALSARVATPVDSE